MNNFDVYSILSDLGLKLTKDNDGFRTKAEWRGGDGNTSVKIWPNGQWKDWVTQESGNFKSLIGLILNIRNKDEIENWLKTKNLEIPDYIREKTEPKLKMQKFLSNDILNSFISNYDYGLGRGISLDTLKLFQTGLVMDGRMKYRYCVPIFDNLTGHLIGITGRAISNSNHIKWKHLGIKKNWIFNSNLSEDSINEKKEVFLVESPFCVLKMWDAGVKNVLCLFGLELSLFILNYLLKCDLEKIYIATNNEESGRGNDAAEKIYRKLFKYFDKKNLQIYLPQKTKDFCEMSCLSIQKYYNERNERKL